MNAAASKLHTVVVVCGEYVVEHGRATVSWWLLGPGKARNVLELEGATAELLELRPRTVREQRVTVRLPSGAMLERVVSEPRHVEADALAWLLKDQRGAARRVARTRFRLGENGQLAKLPRLEALGEAPRPPLKRREPE